MFQKRSIKNISCPCCFSKNTAQFFSRGKVPVYQGVFYKTENEARKEKLGDLDLFFCGECNFVFNNAFKSSLMKYKKGYETNPINSESFSKYIGEMVNYLKKEIKNDSAVVDVGCGGGYFLRKLLKINKNYKGYGFDPCYTGPKTDFGGRLVFRSQYFKSNSLDFPVDLLVCRNVIEHVPNPIVFLKLIKESLSKSPKAHIFFETPSVEWILRNKVIWDFYYEHCSYFTPESIRTLFENSGFKIKKIRTAFRGQHIWLEANLDNRISLSERSKKNKISTLAESFAKEEKRLKNEWKRKINELRKEGPLAVLGAGGKGITFVNLMDPDLKLIACLVDLNPNIQGLFAPGTGHLVISYEQVKNFGIKNAILMNPNYLKENIQKFRKMGIKLNIYCQNYRNSKIVWSKFQS